MERAQGMAYLKGHRAHDAWQVLERWERVADEAGSLEWVELGEQWGYPVRALRTAGDWTEGALYLSAGVHGDEPAAVEGLLRWAESRAGWLGAQRVVVVPLFNPWGLVMNQRHDPRGLDLNRRFDLEGDEGDELMAGWRGLLEGRRFRLGLCLHEDFDGCGVYCYETGFGEVRLAERLMARAAGWVPLDGRDEIDGRPAVAGVIRPETRDDLPEGPGLPEALVLLDGYCEHVLTFETPSEWGLDVRVEAQVAFVDGAIEWIDTGGIELGDGPVT